MPHAHTIKHIRRKLAALRRQVRTWLLIKGTAITAAVLTGLVFLSLLIDRFSHMDFPQRAVMLCLGAGALAFVIIRRILRPLSRDLSEDALCLQVETQHPELQNGLITAVQLARMADAESHLFSPTMQREAVRRGSEAAADLDFGDVLDQKGRRQALLLVSTAIAILLITSLAFPHTMQLWFQRNILLKNVAWPRETTLRILNAQNGVIRIPEAADLILRVEADIHGVIPAEVTVQSRPLENGLPATENMTRLRNNRFQTTFENVQAPFKLRVEGHDHRTEWVDVQLLERPELIDFQLVLKPPDYIQKEQILLTPGQSAYRVLYGSALTVRGRSQKRLRNIRLMRGETTVTSMDAQKTKAFQLHIPDTALKGGSYGIYLTDMMGITMRQPARFIVRIRPDRKPDVRAELRGIGTIILAEAILPLDLRLRDDNALTEAWLLCQSGSGEDTSKESRQELPGLAAELDKQQADIKAESRVDIAPLNLTSGDQLLLRVQAMDNDTVSGPKLGESGTLSLRVVTPEELREDLLRQEQDLHEQFKRIINDQKDLHETCRILQTAIPDDRDVSPDSSTVAHLERGQRKMGQRTADITTQFESLVAQVQNNRLENPEGPLQTRVVNEIIDPMRSLTNTWLPRAAREFRDARAAHADQKAYQESLRQAQKTQEDILARMRTIQASMAKSETIQEAVSLLRKILQRQRELKERTEDKRTETEQSIFE